MSLEDTKEKLEWRKHAFKYEQKNSYGIKKQTDTIHIHYKEVNKISEWNLIYDIINTTKRAEHLNIHYYPIIQVCMNTRLGRSRFKNFQILLDSGYSSIIVMVSLVGNKCLEKDAVMQWHTQAGNITTNYKV